ncbi:Putative U5 small nuclear ribonucleoprotein 200 kDa helicase [Seminavis robusta]|uniref:U5 small nuclear ribonucleoprotein 200 kDa helicase n=1 Tax=Seminavis robusta TaxID=568900 RepID=A0A9N8DP81_9STRA|nr:Putative U5 small nuclear ribonucleoprotein 200 kDa helicase [Seminavis robusta]|eukprot:Sro249_g098630.1 Putative U5 small nuclear ribonucleoprotein 200 kDa helicase (644) ;mRNA; f:24150-26196
MLQYDNSAFYFFALSSLSFYLVPSWWSILKRVVNAFTVSDEAIGAVTRTTAEKKKAEEIKKETKGISTLLGNRSFLLHVLFTLAVTAIFCWLLVSVSIDGEVNTFDPFHILEIDTGADNKAIKKAYRSLSLKYHPDKNPGDRAAEAKFMMVSKAYEALTDEEAKRNYELHGNPDGKQSLEVSIGLPTFLLDTNNRNLVLMVYLIFMVVLVPFGVYTYYSNSSKFGEKDVMYDTYSWFHYTLNEHTIIKSLPELMAGSAEFRKRNMPKDSNEKSTIAKLLSGMRSQMQKPKYNHPVCVKGNVLLHAYLLRKTDALTAGLKEDLRCMLRLSSSLLDAMISVCQHQDSLQTAMNCIELGQYLSQAMWVKDSSLLQLPHFTAEEIKHVEKGKQKCDGILQYRDLPDDQKKGMNDFTDAQKADVAAYLKLFPDITVESKVFVDDDEDDKVYEGDLCTVKVSITHNNVKEGESIGLAHAPLFPYPKQAAWWIILGTKEGKIINIEKISATAKTIHHAIKFLAPRQGEYNFDLWVKSSAYIGCDQKESVKLTTLDNSVLPEYKIHPDDAELDDEPTLFEEILNAHIEQDSDDDDSDDESDAGGDANKKEAVPDSAAAKKKAQLQKARQAAGGDDDDSDDDSDAEEVYAEK